MTKRSSRLRTPLCDQLGLEFPLFQAPIGSSSTVALVSEVSQAGGLGILSGTWREPEELRQMIRDIQRCTDRPFAVNLVLAWPMEERFQICLEERVPIVSLFWGEVGEYVGRGATILHTVGSVAEAAASPAEILVAQGWEAGGHVRGKTSTFVLVPTVVDAVGTRPVVAAGGIADGRGLAAALMLGAQGGWMGTRFLLSHEARVHDHVRARLQSAGAQDAVYTERFDGGWPDAPHRVLENELTLSPNLLPRDPIGTSPMGDPLLRYDMAMPLPGTTGRLDEMPIYAGQSVGLVARQESASEIVRETVEMANQLLIC